MADPAGPNGGDAPMSLDLSAPMTRRQLLRAAALGGTVLLLPGLAACIDEVPLEPTEKEPPPAAAQLDGIDPFLGEIRLMSCLGAPKGWALCDGQLMQINQNQALFALLGTYYGGDGRVNFALPDLRGRVPIHRGPGFNLGQRGGEAAHTLSHSEMPAHQHTLHASPANANSADPAGHLLAGANNLYSPSAKRRFDPRFRELAPLDAVSAPVAFFSAAGALTSLAPGTVSNVGGSQAHLNMQPFLTLNFCIALQGIFPSQT